MSFDTISVIGLGYIGLPTAAMFASKGKNVIGVDINQETIEIINAGKIHIIEPNLDVMVDKAVSQGFLKAVSSPEPADAFLISVPTPFLNLNANEIPKPDLGYIESAAKALAPVLKKGDLVVLESTSPVGATEQMATWLSDIRADLTFPHTSGDSSDIRIAYCPERVLPGQVVKELVQNDRIIGGISQACSQAAVKLYETFTEGACVITNARTAEMAKLTENASRDVSIAFANELSIVCDKLNIDIWELIGLANRHPRVNILNPGPGVGGHCIAVDPWFIVSDAPDESILIQAARRVNDGKPGWVVDKIESVLNEIRSLPSDYERTKINVAFYGLAFKADIDDLRESPSVEIVKSFAATPDIDISVIEPNIDKLPDELHFCSLMSINEAIEKADVHVMLVNHKAFYKMKPINGLIIDTQGIW